VVTSFEPFAKREICQSSAQRELAGFFDEALFAIRCSPFAICEINRRPFMAPNVQLSHPWILQIFFR
jgi:hypothetical protein